VERFLEDVPASTRQTYRGNPPVSHGTVAATEWRIWFERIALLRCATGLDPAIRLMDDLRCMNFQLIYMSDNLTSEDPSTMLLQRRLRGYSVLS
jgi:hypothetical protein